MTTKILSSSSKMINQNEDILKINDKEIDMTVKKKSGIEQIKKT